MTTDPLAKKIQEIKAAQKQVAFAVDKLMDHLNDYGCLRDDLIENVKITHLAHKKSLGG